MYRVLPTKRFRRSLKKLKHSGMFSSRAEENFNEAINLLTAGKPLPATYLDHQLTGDRKDQRECHIKGDLLLVYEHRDDVLVLLLIDIGTHSQIFG